MISLNQTPHFTYLACAAVTLYDYDEQGLSQLLLELDFNQSSVEAILENRNILISKAS